MKRLLLLICILSVSYISVFGQNKIRLKVGTFNIRMDTKAKELPDSWAERKNRVKTVIKNYDFDILGTQEGYHHQLQELLELKDYNYAGIGRDDGNTGGEHSAIFYKKDKFTVLEKGDFWYSETPEKVSMGWDARINRLCTWVKFKENKSGKEFYVFNSHYDHEASKARRESAKLMLMKIKEIVKNNSPVFSMGDFNAVPESEPIQIIYKDNFLKDSYLVTKEGPFGPIGTFHNYDMELIPLGRIDYIFVTPNIRVLKYQVLDDIIDDYYPSDHFAVAIDVIL